MLKNVIIKLSKEKSDNIIKAIMNNIQTFSDPKYSFQNLGVGRTNQTKYPPLLCVFSLIWIRDHFV
jgi:hypothetical protein